MLLSDAAGNRCLVVGDLAGEIHCVFGYQNWRLSLAENDKRWSMSGTRPPPAFVNTSAVHELPIRHAVKFVASITVVDRYGLNARVLVAIDGGGGLHFISPSGNVMKSSMLADIPDAVSTVKRIFFGGWACSDALFRRIINRSARESSCTSRECPDPVNVWK
jgi:hypothetical protein